MADIVLVSPTFHPEKVGTPVYATDIGRGLAAHGHQVRVVTNQPYYPRFRRFDGYGRATRHDHLDDAIPVVRLPTIVPRGGAPLWRAASEANMLLQLAMHVLLGLVGLGGIKRSDHVIAVSPGVPFAVLGARLLRRRGGRLLVIVHDVQFGLADATASSALTGVLKRMEVFALSRADAVAVLSDEMAATLAEAGLRAPTEVVGLWPTIRPTGAAADPDLVMYSGNLGRKQGVGVLLDIAHELSVLRPTARMLIRGDGSERATLVDQARRRGLDNVTFKDFVDEAELAAALESAAVHVVPQLADTADHAVPSKVFNILAVGRPVVALTPAGGTLDRLADEVDAVVAVPTGDAREAAAAVARLMDAAASTASSSGHLPASHQRDAAMDRYLGMLDLVV